MRKVILYIAASLDGYIAKANGDTAWLHDERYAIAGEDYGYSALIGAIDTTLMGHSTYKVILGFDMPFPYPDKANYVFSRSEQADTVHVRFVHENPVAFVQQLKQQEGKDIWLIGGGQLNTLLLNAGLIDEIVLTYVPIILGSGISLFAQDTQEANLQVSQNKSFANGFVQLTLVK